MITSLADLRPSYSRADEQATIPPLVGLTTRPAGSDGPTPVCLPEFAAAAHWQEVARLGQGLGPPRHVLAAVIPGYTTGGPVATDPVALLDLFVESFLATPDVGPYVLAGYSSGGLIAQVLAARLTERGRPPAAM